MSSDLKLVLSGVSYAAALSEVNPERVTPVGKGCRVTLVAESAGQREAWIDLMAVAACDAAEDGHLDITEALYRDIERNDIAAGKVPA